MRRFGLTLPRHFSCRDRVEWQAYSFGAQGFRRGCESGGPTIDGPRSGHAACFEAYGSDVGDAARRRSMGGRWLARHDRRDAARSLRSSSSRLSARGRKQARWSRRRCRGTEWGQNDREQNATNASERDKKRRIFKGRWVDPSVRDEGVAGSNPATPTSFPHNRSRQGE